MYFLYSYLFLFFWSSNKTIFNLFSHYFSKMLQLKLEAAEHINKLFCMPLYLTLFVSGLNIDLTHFFTFLDLKLNATSFCWYDACFNHWKMIALISYLDILHWIHKFKTASDVCCFSKRTKWLWNCSIL